jgi:hypothetical protein
LSFTSTEPAPQVHNLSIEDPEPPVPPVSESRGRSEANDMNLVSASVGAHEASEIEAHTLWYFNTTWERGKRRKQSQVAAVLDNYLGHKIKQSEMGAIFEKRNQEEEYSIEKCLDTVDAMEELTDEEKAITAEVFEKDMNRQMFMKQKNLNVRLIWLRRKIRYAYFHCHPLHSENKSEEAHVIFCYLGLALGLHQFEC